MSLEYNTSKEPLLLKEYGRNVQKLVQYITKTEDKEERTRQAYCLIKLLKQLNPMVRESGDNIQRVWDHLYLMSGLKLDVDSDFPMPDEDVLFKKPKKVAYNKNRLKFKHYGRNIELMIQNIKGITDFDKKKKAIGTVGKLMKSFYANWNHDRPDDKVILEHLRIMSDGDIDLSVEFIREEKLFETNHNERRHHHHNTRKHSSGRAYFNKRRRKHN